MQLYLLQAVLNFGAGDGLTCEVQVYYYMIDHVSETNGTLGVVALQFIYSLSGTEGEPPAGIFFALRTGPDACVQAANPGDQFTFDVCADGAPIAQFFTGEYEFGAISEDSGGGPQYGDYVQMGKSNGGINWAGTLSSLTLQCLPTDSCNQILV